MKRRFFAISLTIAALAVAIAGLLAFKSGDYFKINKSFETFGSVFREVANNYVLDVDPDIMIKNGIEGMLSTLDPYTEYYNNDFAEDLDILTDGLYTGFGFTIAQIDSQTTIIGLNENNSAFKNGLRIGDRIYKIDSSIVLNLASDKLRELTRGKLGSKATLAIIREGLKDTLSFNLTRENINLPNVSYYGITENNIAYIKIDAFAKNSANEVRSAYFNMKNETDLKGIVLDFRDNPGGLLASAIGIVELFVPKNSLIVSTRGANKNNAFEYNSAAEPIDTLLPMAVLINGGSASASEIVAGAIQDLDRGIIVGQRSFGKGLVQSIFDMPYNSFLKMTTAKYYTPSGRCIQKIKFGQLYNKTEIAQNTDTTIFYTKNGRPVYELTGILPDTVVTGDTMPEIIKSFFNDNLLFNFSNYYAAKHDSLSKDFSISNSVFAEFEKYIKQKDYFFLSRSADYLSKLESEIKRNKYPKKTLQSLNNLKRNIVQEDSKELRKYKKDISKYLRYEILRRFYSNKDIVSLFLSEDKDLQVANSLLSSKKYKAMLKPEQK